jgi:hypothetical protein
MKLKVLSVAVICLALGGVLVNQQFNQQQADVSVSEQSVAASQQVGSTTLTATANTVVNTVVNTANTATTAKQAEVVKPVGSLAVLLSEERVPVESYFESVTFNQPSKAERADPKKMLAFEKREQTNLLENFIGVIDKEVKLFKTTLASKVIKVAESEQPLLAEAQDRLSQLELLHSDLTAELAEMQSQVL